MVSALIVNAAQKDATLLNQTLSRMEKTLIRHGSRIVAGYMLRFNARDFRGCQISYEMVPQLGPDHQGYRPFIERTDIDLTTLDSSHVSMTKSKDGSTFSIYMVTRDGKPTIETRRAIEAHTFGDPSRVSVTSLVVTDKSAAETVRAALVQSIELCTQ